LVMVCKVSVDNSQSPGVANRIANITSLLKLTPCTILNNQSPWNKFPAVATTERQLVVATAGACNPKRV